MNHPRLHNHAILPLKERQRKVLKMKVATPQVTKVTTEFLPSVPQKIHDIYSTLLNEISFEWKFIHIVIQISFFCDRAPGCRKIKKVLKCASISHGGKFPPTF